MSEKNEIIFISEYAADKIAFGRQDFFQISVGIKPYNSDDVPYIIKSKYDELSLENARLAADLESLKNLLKMKIAGGGGVGTPLEGTGGIAYGVGGEVRKHKIVLGCGTTEINFMNAHGGAGGESPSEQTIEDNPDFTQKGGDFMKGKSEETK